MVKEPRKRRISLLMTLAMVLILLPAAILPAKADPAEVTSDTTWYNDSIDSFTITTPDELVGLAQLVDGGKNFVGKTITLGADIVFNDTSDFSNWQTSPPLNEFNLIGFDLADSFAGTFDGGGYTITGLYIKGDEPTSDYNLQALFAYTTASATIKNLTLSDCYSYGNIGVAGICGINYGTISGCSVSGVIEGFPDGDKYGGIAGENNGTISSCINDADVINAKYHGGIAGINTGTIYVCYNTGNIRDFNGDPINSDSEAGGIVPRNLGVIANCYNLGSVTGYAAGGIAASNAGLVTNCYSAASITGNSAWGLLSNYSAGTIEYSYWDRELFAGNGYNGETGTNCEGKTTADMQSAAFLTLLNAHRSPYHSWVAGAGGYPAFALNTAPTDITLSAASIDENVDANTTVGTLSVTDPDAGDSITYDLVDGTGDTDNASFQIIVNSLQIIVSPDYETKSSYSVRIRATDMGGLYVEQPFTITINNLNEAPSITAPSSISVIANVFSALTGVSFADADAQGGSVTVTLSVSPGNILAKRHPRVEVDDSSAVTLSGTIADINDYVAGNNLAFISAEDTPGSVILTVSVNYNDDSGSGEPLSSSVNITLELYSTPLISSAIYDAATGRLIVTGTNLQDTDQIDVSKFTVTGEGGFTRNLTSENVQADSKTHFTITLNDDDKGVVNAIFNNIGTQSTSGTPYTLSVTNGWVLGSESAAADSGKAITVSNVATPTITSAAYNASTGELVVTGTGFLMKAGSANDIVAAKFTVTGGSEETYTLDDTPNVDIQSTTRFILTLGAEDKAAVNLILNKNGTTSKNGTVYNLKAAEDWAAGAYPSVTVADTAGKPITASNVLPVISDENISINSGTGTGGAFKIGDTVTAAWDNTASGDNNSDITSVTVNFSQFGGGAAVAAANSEEIWTASYTIVEGSVDGTNKNISVTATDNAGNSNTREDTTNATVDNIRPTNITVSCTFSADTGANGDFITNTALQTISGELRESMGL